MLPWHMCQPASKRLPAIGVQHYQQALSWAGKVRWGCAAWPEGNGTVRFTKRQRRSKPRRRSATRQPRQGLHACPVWPCGHADEGIIAQRADGSQSNVTGGLHRPLIVRFEQDGANEPRNGILFGEDAHHLYPPVHLPVHPFSRVAALQLGPWSAPRFDRTGGIADKA